MEVRYWMGRLAVRPLVVATLRAVRRGPLAGAMAAGLVVVAVPAVGGVDLSPDDHTVLLRLAVVCAAAGLAFVFDDPAKPTMATTPAPTWTTPAIRAAAAASAAAAWWALALATTRAGAGPLPLPVRDLTLEAGVIVVLTVATAALACRLVPGGVGGPLAAPAALALVAALAVAPVRPAMFVLPSATSWPTVHHRWGALLAVLIPLAAMAVACPSPRRAPFRGVPRRRSRPTGSQSNMEM